MTHPRAIPLAASLFLTAIAALGWDLVALHVRSTNMADFAQWQTLIVMLAMLAMLATLATRSRERTPFVSQRARLPVTQRRERRLEKV
jgi:hypothetical protein